MSGDTKRRKHVDKALEHEKIYQRYAMFNKFWSHAMYLFFVFLGISDLAMLENTKILTIGSIAYVSTYILFLYGIVFYFRRQELAKKTEGLALCILSYFNILLFVAAVTYATLSSNYYLVIAYVVFSIVTILVSYMKHSKNFSSQIKLYIQEKQIDIDRGVHNIAKKKGDHRWSRILYPKSYDKNQSSLNNALIFKWAFILNAVVIALCKYLSQDFKLYLVSVLGYSLSLFLSYFSVFYFVVLRFILRMEKEHGYEFRMVYEPDPEPIKKELTRAQKRKRERMLAKEQQANNKRK